MTKLRREGHVFEVSEDGSTTIHRSPVLAWSTPRPVRAGRAFTVLGHVLDYDGEFRADVQSPDVTISVTMGRGPVGQATTAIVDGVLSLPALINVPGSYVLTPWHEGEVLLGPLFLEVVP